jgi:hypothetical protein
VDRISAEMLGLNLYCTFKAIACLWLCRKNMRLQILLVQHSHVVPPLETEI